MAPTRPRVDILMVEDDRANFDRVTNLLSAWSSEFALHQAARIADAIQLAARQKIDVILLELDGPDSSELAALSEIRSALLDRPIVVLSDGGDQSFALHALELGAQDCLQKGATTGELLVRSLRYAMTRHGLQTQVRNSERQLKMIFDQLPAMLWTTDCALEITSLRGRELRLLRPHAERIDGKGVTGLFAVDEINPAPDEMHHRALLGDSTSADWQVGGRWYHAHVEPLTNASGDILGTIGVALDITDERKLRKDIQAAHHIQQYLLPAHSPHCRGFDIAGRCFPAEDCSGDFFDYIPMPNGRQCIVLADVSGHGFGPAILAAAIRSYLRTAAVLGNQVHEMLALSNRLLNSDGEFTPFASVFVASLNPEERTFRFASAGHPAYLVRATGESITLESMSVPIGVRADETFTLSSRHRMRAGDILLLISDGVFEARTERGQYFGLNRALDTVHQLRHQSASAIVDRLHQEVLDFTGRRTLDDDLTAIVVRLVDETETHEAPKALSP